MTGPNQEGNGENPPNEEDNAELKEAVAPEPMLNIKDLELERLRRDASEYKDKYLRTLAEMDNAKKRLQKDRQEIVQTTTEHIVLDFLSPIDHMEHALKHTDHMSGDVKNWVMGFQMILTQFQEALASNGIKPIQSKGGSFDPHQHEAIEMIVTIDHPEGTVVEESVKGYKMGERIIRPARVKVAKAPSDQLNEEQ